MQDLKFLRDSLLPEALSTGEEYQVYQTLRDANLRKKVYLYLRQLDSDARQAVIAGCRFHDLLELRREIPKVQPDMVDSAIFDVLLKQDHVKFEAWLTEGGGHLLAQSAKADIFYSEELRGVVGRLLLLDGMDDVGVVSAKLRNVDYRLLLLLRGKHGRDDPIHQGINALLADAEVQGRFVDALELIHFHDMRDECTEYCVVCLVIPCQWGV